MAPPQTPSRSGPPWVWSDWMTTWSAGIAPSVAAAIARRASMIPVGESRLAANQPWTSASATAKTFCPSLTTKARTLGPTPRLPVAWRSWISTPLPTAVGPPMPKPPRKTLPPAVAAVGLDGDRPGADPDLVGGGRGGGRGRGCEQRGDQDGKAAEARHAPDNDAPPPDLRQPAAGPKTSAPNACRPGLPGVAEVVEAVEVLDRAQQRVVVVGRVVARAGRDERGEQHGAGPAAAGPERQRARIGRVEPGLLVAARGRVVVLGLVEGDDEQAAVGVGGGRRDPRDPRPAGTRRR